MSMNVVSFKAIGVLARQADLTVPQKRLWFGVIRQAIEDLGEPSIPVHENAFPADSYFSTADFERHAEACELSPEYVRDVLEEHGLLRGGERARTTEFIAA